MNIYYVSCIILAVAKICSSSGVVIKGDSCSKFDSCQAKPHLRTCSCEPDCHLYGICCRNSGKHQQSTSNAPFQCYQQHTITPVFAKRSCSDDYRGNTGNIQACFEQDVDDMDVHNNLLVTSHKTKVIYWNWHCAKCNNEEDSDLELWSIAVFCPPRAEVDRRLIRRNLTFIEETKQWGLNIDGEFVECAVKYAPPEYTDEAKHCTPNLISSCPEGYNISNIICKCDQYYGERILKHSGKYYKNVHCAICNGVELKELECSGMSRPEDFAEETDFKKMAEEVFTKGRWLEKKAGERFKCSKGFIYGPVLKKCRRYEYKPMPVVDVESSCDRPRVGLASLLVLLILLC